ncbi:MAG: AraC family transcriptional regulator [Paenibacillus sp.]|jgi:AraC-like DNA-binding protein/mannose-6-phosphate isomerase-like protein (cupin superfamily)|nr:AraC family transcriptional regulator [Paenibacillus sp.]
MYFNEPMRHLYFSHIVVFRGENALNLGSILALTPVINFAIRDAAEPERSWGPRTIPDCQFFYVIEGEAELLMNQNRYRILPGQCVFFGADSPHHLSTLTAVSFYSVHFHWSHHSPEPIHPAYRIRLCDPGELSCHTDLYELDIPSIGTIKIPHWFEAPELEQLFIRIAKEYQAEKPGYPFMLRALMMELITSLTRHIVNQSLIRTNKIEAALEVMLAFPEQERTVEQLAALCGYHPTYFTRLFKEETGRTPKHYMISEKIKRAKQLLLSGESLEGIAHKLNYNNLHYFSHQFKKETGLNPSEFRQQGNVTTTIAERN